MSVLKIKKDGVWENVSGTSGHTHTRGDITNFPESLPANGGDADTVDGKHASDFALASDVNEMYQNVGALVGDTSVAEQITNAVASKSDISHTHNEYADVNHTHIEYALAEHEHVQYALNSDVNDLQSLVGHVSVTEQIDAAVSLKADAGHTHDEYADVNHEHEEYAISDHEHNQYAFNDNVAALRSLVGDTSVSEQINVAINTKADIFHNHDDKYDTKGTANSVLEEAKAYIADQIANMSQIQIITLEENDE